MEYVQICVQHVYACEGVCVGCMSAICVCMCANIRECRVYECEHVCVGCISAMRCVWGFYKFKLRFWCSLNLY